MTTLRRLAVQASPPLNPQHTPCVTPVRAAGGATSNMVSSLTLWASRLPLPPPPSPSPPSRTRGKMPGAC